MGGTRNRVDWKDVEAAMPLPEDDILALNEALDQLAELEPRTAELVKLRYFAGFTNREAAETLGSRRALQTRFGPIARVWLHDRITGQRPG